MIQKLKKLFGLKPVSVLNPLDNLKNDFKRFFQMGAFDYLSNSNEYPKDFFYINNILKCIFETDNASFGGYNTELRWVKQDNIPIIDNLNVDIWELEYTPSFATKSSLHSNNVFVIPQSVRQVNIFMYLKECYQSKIHISASENTIVNVVLCMQIGCHRDYRTDILKCSSATYQLSKWLTSKYPLNSFVYCPCFFEYEGIANKKGGVVETINEYARRYDGSIIKTMGIYDYPKSKNIGLLISDDSNLYDIEKITLCYTPYEYEKFKNDFASFDTKFSVIQMSGIDTYNHSISVTAIERNLNYAPNGTIRSFLNNKNLGVQKEQPSFNNKDKEAIKAAVVKKFSNTTEEEGTILAFAEFVANNPSLFFIHSVSQWVSKPPLSIRDFNFYKQTLKQQ